MAAAVCGCDRNAEPVSYKKTQPNVEALKLNFGWKDIFKSLRSMIRSVLDEVSDIMVAVTYFKEDEMKSFALILGILLVSSIATTIISLYWFKETTKRLGLEVSPREWIFRFIFHIFQFGLIWRHVEYMSCVWKSRRNEESREKYAQYLVSMKQESSLLNLFSTYLESAPELIIQVCLLATPTPGIPSEFKLDSAMLVRILSIILSITSLAEAVPDLQDTVRDLHPMKRTLSEPGKLVRFLWHFFTNASRAIALGLFASVFPVYTVLVCAGHWLMVTIYLFVMRLQHLEEVWEELIFKPIIGLIYIFTYMKLQKGPTLKACCIYYVLVFLEGSVMLFVWLQHSDPDLWFRVMLFATFFACFVVGVSFMAMFYCVFHPSRMYSGVKDDDNVPISNDYEEQLNNHVTLFELDHPTPRTARNVPHVNDLAPRNADIY